VWMTVRHVHTCQGRSRLFACRYTPQCRRMSQLAPAPASDVVEKPPPPAAIAEKPPQASGAPSSDEPPQPVELKWPRRLGVLVVSVICGTGMVSHQYGEMIGTCQQAANVVASQGGESGAMLMALLLQPLTMLPVDDAKLSLLRNGALEFWIWALYQVPSIESLSIATLSELLRGSPAVEFFYSKPAYYRALIGSMMPLLEAQDAFCSRRLLPKDSDLTKDVLHLGALLAANPHFLKSQGTTEDCFWRALLEMGPEQVLDQPDLELLWLSIAATTLQRTSLAYPMVFDAKFRTLLGDFAFGKVEGSGELHERYAVWALHRLAFAVASEDAPRFGIGNDRYVDEFLAVDLPELPAWPPVEADSGSAALTISCCGAAGLVWGFLRGMSKGSRLQRRIGMSSLKAACGAALLESTVQLMSAMSNQLPFLEHSLDGSANFKTMAPATAVLAAEVSVVFGLLHLLQPSHCAPFSMGGWILGRLLYSLVEGLGLPIE